MGEANESALAPLRASCALQVGRVSAVKDEVARLVAAALERLCHPGSLIRVGFSPPQRTRVLIQWEIPEDMRTYVQIGAPPEFVEAVKVVGVWRNEDPILRIGALDLWELNDLSVEAKKGEFLRVNLESPIAGHIFVALGRLSQPCKSDTKSADCN